MASAAVKAPGSSHDGAGVRSYARNGIDRTTLRQWPYFYLGLPFLRLRGGSDPQPGALQLDALHAMGNLAAYEKVGRENPALLWARELDIRKAAEYVCAHEY
jgi:hypothetical protein